MKKLAFATNNNNKLSEVQAMLSSNFDVIGLKDLGIFEDIPENENTLEANARAKATYVHNKMNIDVFADDTGLEIEALDGEPGVLSARYAGLNKDANDNMNLVLQKLQLVKNRKAQFRTSICLILDNKEYFFEGKVKGIITSERAGKKGFGYDPIFIPYGYDKTFAEINPDEKNKISHRGLAVQELVKFLNNRIK